jgi:two-component system LytT family response regulator
MPAALIIDDEPPACDILRALLAEHPSVVVVGEAGTVATARTLLAQPDYDLVFLDVQLRGGSGFDLVECVRPGARIIFVTAFDEHALRAFAVNALDYLLKPVAPERLALSLARLAAPVPPLRAESHPPFASSATDTPFPNTLTLDDRILVRIGPSTDRFVRLGDIRYIASNENYTEIFLAAGTRFLVRRSLKYWEDALPSAHFARAHRHLIVNLNHVESIERATVSTYHLQLNGLPEPLRASFRYIAGLRTKLAR